MTGRHAVSVDTLRAYSEKLSGNVAVATEIQSLVAQSDVGNESWGIVGLFVKGTYSSMLGDLNALIVEMGSGLKSASEKIGHCADIYQQMEDDAANAFSSIMSELDRQSIPTVTMGPA